jgi:predicted RNA-binding Zn-ribbon protein involved in translation (DUF1610 family)
VGSIDSRLRRLEEHGHRCPECGLAPGERRTIAVIYEEQPERSFQGDPNERCASCGRALYTVFNVVYDPPAAYEGGGVIPIG